MSSLLSGHVNYKWYAIFKVLITYDEHLKFEELSQQFRHFLR